MLNFLLFSKTVTFETYLSEEKFLLGVERNSNGQERTQGDIFDNGFHLTYSSLFAMLFPNPLPAIEVIGQTSNNGAKTRIDIKIKLSDIPRYVFPLGVASIVGAYFLDKFGFIDAQGLSDTIIPLFSIPFAYGFLLLLYLKESRSCEEHFETMIRFIERENKNEL